jgi:hypothetical protein
LKDDPAVIDTPIEGETIASSPAVPEMREDDLEERDLEDLLVSGFHDSSSLLRFLSSLFPFQFLTFTLFILHFY